MPITPTNQSKNTVSPNNGDKSGVALWGDAEITWGDSLAYWGNVSLVNVTNQSKSVSSGSTINAGEAMGLLLTITYPSTFTSGGGWVNSNKN